jgi:hypothetical protein
MECTLVWDMWFGWINQSIQARLENKLRKTNSMYPKTIQYNMFGCGTGPGNLFLNLCWQIF